MRLAYLRQLRALALALLAAGCGGSDDAPRTGLLIDDTPSQPTSDDVLLAFLTAAGELKTVDPASPAAAPPTVDSGIDTDGFWGSFLGIYGGTYRDDLYALDNPYMGGVVYVKGGKVWRVSLVKGTSQDEVQVSSLANACGIFSAYEDYGNLARSRVLVATASGYPDCTIVDGSALVRLDTASTGAATVVSEQLLHVLRGTDGAPNGWLAYANGALSRYGVDLANPVEIAAGSFPDVAFFQPDRQTFYLRMLLDGETDECLYRYDAGTGTLSACLHTFVADTLFWSPGAIDGTALYFVDGNVVHYVGHADTGSVPIVDHGSGFEIQRVALSANRLVVSSRNAGASQSKLTSGSRMPFNPLDPPVTGLSVTTSYVLSLDAVAGPWVYYTERNSTYAQATRARDDGSGSALTQYAAWGGVSISPARLSLDGDWQAHTHHVGYGTYNPSTYLFTIRAYDAQAGTALAPLGGVQSLTGSFSAAIGRYRLSEFRLVKGMSSDTDVYFMDTLTENSLRPVAQTSGADDRIVF